jgi:lambda family phage portal protein
MSLLGAVKNLMEKSDEARTAAIERNNALLDKIVKKRYAAAKIERLDNPDLGYGNQRDFNALLEQANPVLRARVRGLVRNFTPFVRAIKAHSAFVVGKGAKFQSLVTLNDGKPDKKRRNIIESRFQTWMDQASTDGRMHFYDCQRLALRQRLETGEFFCQFRTPRSNSRHPFALQFIEPDRVNGGEELRSRRKGTVLWQGIEFDPHTGERFGYWVERPSWPQRFEYGWDFVRADHMLHGYDLLRPDQLRGVSPFAPAIILADNMYDYTEAELDAAKMAAKWLGVVKSPDPSLFQLRRDEYGGNSLSRDRIMAIENATMEYLEPGEDITFMAAPNRIQDSFDRFVSYVLRMIGAVIGVPYEVLSGDYQGINYSTARMSRQDYHMILEPERFWLERTFNRPVFREWLKWTALTEPNILPNYFKDPGRYEKAIWITAGMPSPDPQKEGRADIDNIAAGLDSPQAAILRNGGDPEQKLAEIAEWNAQCEELGLKFDPSNAVTAMQTNPAALEEQPLSKGKWK